MHPQTDMTWLLGVSIGGGITAFFIVVAIALTLMSIFDTSNYSGPDWGVGAFTCWVIGIIAGLITFGISLPWPAQYHTFYPKTGIVKVVSSRFLASGNGNGTNQKFVVTFTNGQTYGCNDTRCALVQPGDKLTMMCERSFQFNAPDEGWDCNWGRDVKPNGAIIP